MPKSASEIEDDRLIRELVQNWAIWRDGGDWGDFCRPVSATEIACK